MNYAKFYGVFFLLMTIGLILNVYYIVKNNGRGGIPLLTKLGIVGLPFMWFTMWSNENISATAKIIDTFLAVIAIAAGIIYWIFVPKKTAK